MSITIYLLTGLIGLIVSGIFAFIDIKITYGIILSTVFSLINLVLLSASMKKIISSDQPSYGLMIAGNMIRFTLLFVMMFIAYRFPTYFSMIGVAIGLTLFMVALLIDAIKKRRS